MARAPSFCGVVLAAGESSRMGRDKALLPWPPLDSQAIPPGPRHTFLTAAIQMLEAHSELVIVVAGKNAMSLTPMVQATSAFLVVNPAPERGQFSSMQVGLQEVLNRGRDAAIVTLVDRPPVRSSTIEILIAAFREAVAENRWAVVPQFGDKHGHPILIGREMIEVFLKAPANSTAREIEHQQQHRIEYVSVDDPTVPLNVDTPEDYSHLAGK